MELSLFFYLIIFIFGLIVGSFLNCVIYRLETGGNFLKGRSFCPNCKHILTWQDLIPFLSFIFLKGKCRYCHQKISYQYPLVELTMGILFIFIFRHLDFGLDLKFEFWILDLFYYLIIASLLVIIFVYDLKHYIIPDKIVYPAIVLAFLYQSFRIWNFGNYDLFRISDLGFGILPSLFFLAIILGSRSRWMGLGDFKLAILMGLFLGYPGILVALFFAFCVGAIIGIGLVIFREKTFKSEIPFGPFLVIGTFIALFWGKTIINWYLSLFL